MAIKKINQGTVINTYEQDDADLDEVLEIEQESAAQLNLKDPVKEIIERELKEIYKTVVTDGIMMDKDEVSKFEKLVKCLVAIETGRVEKDEKKKKKPENMDALLKRVMSA